MKTAEALSMENLGGYVFLRGLSVFYQFQAMGTIKGKLVI